MQTVSYSSNGLDLSVFGPVELPRDDPLRAHLLAIVRQNMKATYDATGGAWAWSDDRKRRELAHPDARFLLARDRAGGAIAGFAHLRFEADPTGVVVYVYELQLNQACCNRGLGTFLMQAIEAIARERGMHAVRLTCLTRNVRAMRFYRRLGYEVLPRVVDGDSEEMQKAIPPSADGP